MKNEGGWGEIPCTPHNLISDIMDIFTNVKSKIKWGATDGNQGGVRLPKLMMY